MTQTDGAKAATKRWRLNNPDRVRESTMAWQKANPEKVRASAGRSRLKRRYGITPEIYRALEISQQGECAVCGEKPKRLTVEHSHEPSFVRALVCDGCNTVIGSIEGPRYQAAKDYLVKGAHHGKD